LPVLFFVLFSQVLLCQFCFMIKVELQSQSFNLKQSFEELSEHPKDFQTVLKLCAAGIEAQSRLSWELIVRSLLGASESFWAELVLSLDQWVILKRESKWVFKSKLLVKPFNSFKCQGVKYLLPEPNFGKLSTGQVSYAMVYLTQTSNGDLEALDWLLATLCLPVGQVYNDIDTEDRAAKFKTLEPYTKGITLKYITDSLSEFVSDYEDMFGKGGTPRYEHGEGWYYMQKNAAKAGYYPSIEAVSKAAAAEVWGLMLDDAKDQSETKTKTA